MSEVSSSLVVAEKKPTRPGGCVGIFFQLFDWNRRIAKKKLFSKKLLPPARAKRAAKKFGGEDKLPTAKLLLIDEENRGGFPNGKKSGVDGSREMRSPSLVARLMGLESMPAVRREKPKKGLASENSVGEGRNRGDGDNAGCSEQSDQFVCDREEFRMGKGHGKVESRPQKLQKTGLFERRAVTRFGAEALQFRSVMSRSRKHHHQPKLASPVKSPRVGRNASSRLMGAATRILEPGVHASSRAKCALTYARTAHTVEETREPNYYASVPKQPKGQPSCKSCGNWLDVVDSRSNVEERVEVSVSPALGLGNAPPLGPGRTNPKTKPQEAALLRENGRRSKSTIEKKHVFREYQEHYHPPSHLVRYQNEPVPARTKRQSQISPKERDNTRPRLHSRIDPFLASSSAHGTKESVCVNGNSASRTKSSMPSKAIPKKRPINGRIQVENDNCTQPTSRNHRGSGNDVVGRVIGLNRCSRDQNRVKSDANSGAAESKKGSSVISFTFSSPMRHNSDSPSPTTLEKSRVQGEFTGNNSSPRKKLTFGVSTEQPSSRLATHLRGDALGALLEEKLKELTCRDRDELETGDGPAGRSTAVILEELIHALTAERQPISPDDGDSCSIELSHDDSSSYASRDASNDALTSLELIADHKIQAEIKSPGGFVGFPLGGDGVRHSPGSVLDASFSNDSCFSESLDGHSGRKLHSESMERSYNQPQPSMYDVELSDCATSISTMRTRIDRARESLHHIQSVLYGDANTGFVGSKLSYVTEVIVSADLLCGPLFEEAHTAGEFPIALLVDKLEGLYTTPNFQVGFIESKDEYQRRRFLLDCLIEFLDSRRGLYCNSRFKRYAAAHPLRISGESLTLEVREEIQRWSDLAGKTCDDILEKEMNRSLGLGKWVDFEMEGFEIGEKMGSDILQLLVNEVVIELKQNSLEKMFSC